MENIRKTGSMVNMENINWEKNIRKIGSMNSLKNVELEIWKIGKCEKW